MARGSRLRVVLFTIAIATAALASLAMFACSSFSEAETTNAGAEAGAQAEGAADGGASGADATRLRCNEREAGLLLCEDFEKTLFGWIDNADSSIAEIVPSPSGSGNVLRAQLPAGITRPNEFIYRDVSWGDDVYVRLFVYLEKALQTDDVYPFIVLPPVELDLLRNAILLHQYQSPNFTRSAGDLFPIAKWTCVEWRLTPTESTVWLNGDVAVSAPDATFFASPTRITLGLKFLGTTTSEATLYLDDLAVGTSRIGCN
jgi:hypothetical protein